jgi:hypothetical protein
VHGYVTLLLFLSLSFKIFTIRDLTLFPIEEINSIKISNHSSRCSLVKALAVVIVASAFAVWVFCTLLSPVDGLLGDGGALSRQGCECGENLALAVHNAVRYKISTAGKTARFAVIKLY